MKLSIKPTCGNGSIRGRRFRAAFTFAEVLAAMVFMGIVIPVAIEGLRVANRAGVVAQRKGVAAQLADNLLNELVATGQWRDAAQSGTFGESRRGYRWRMMNENWTKESMRMITIEVLYQVQNQEYSVLVSTLVPPTTD